jgi:hypothetical protein
MGPILLHAAGLSHGVEGKPLEVAATTHGALSCSTSTKKRREEEDRRQIEIDIDIGRGGGS